MIHPKDHKTSCLFDPWDRRGPKRRRLIEQSWAGLLGEHILLELPVNMVSFTLLDGLYLMSLDLEHSFLQVLLYFRKMVSGN